MDLLKCQTSAASPAEPGELLLLFSRLEWEADMISEISSNRLFGLVLGGILLTALVLNAMAF